MTRTTKVRARLAAVLGASMVLSLLAAGPVAATHVVPEKVLGNPTCEDLGYDEGVKVDPPADGTYDLPKIDPVGTIEIELTGDGEFTWTSDGVVILAVIVKGGAEDPQEGPSANVYRYNPPPTTTDTGLHAPHGFSHIEICFEDEQPGSLEIEKVVTGGPEGFEGDFDFHVDCGDGGEFDVTVSSGSSETIDGIPAGSECTIEETDGPDAPAGFEWGEVDIDPNPVTIGSGTTVTVTATNPLNEIEETPTLVIEKANDAPGVGEEPLEDGDTVNYKLDYTLTNGPVDDGIIEDVLPAGVTYVNGSATDSVNGEFVFDGYDAGTRTLTWLAVEVTESGSVTYAATIDEGAAELPQPLTNTACIDSDDTDEDCAESDVFVGEEPLAETAPPNTAPPTDISAAGDSGVSGGSMLLVLLALAGIAVAVAFVAPTPASIRKRMR